MAFENLNYGVGNATGNDWPLIQHSTIHDAVNAIIACLAVLGNSVVIFVMLARKRVFKSFTNRLILHQSVIDLAGGMMFFFHYVLKGFDVSVSIHDNIYDQLACRFLYPAFLVWCTNVASTYNLVIISLERLMATCYPVKHRNTWSTDKLKFAVGAAWGIGVAYSSHLLIMFEAHQGYCKLVDVGPYLGIFVSILVVTIEYFLPLLCMTYAYTRIARMITKKQANPAGSQQTSLSKAKKNVLMTVFLAVIMYVVCWTPNEIDYLRILLFQEFSDDVVYKILASLLACNAWVNPVIYCAKYDLFRAQLKDILQRRLRQNQVHEGETTTSTTVS